MIRFGGFSILRMWILPIALYLSVMPITIYAQALPLIMFKTTEACPDADVFIRLANSAVASDKGSLQTRFNTFNRVIGVGDAFADCGKRFLSNPTGDPTALRSIAENLFMDSLEARFAATVIWTQVIDLDASHKASKDSSDIFASTAHAAFYTLRVVKLSSPNASDLRRASEIDATLQDLVLKYGAGHLDSIYDGLP